MARPKSINITDARSVSSYKQYNQSSNSLFHFMSEPEYLLDALARKALVPRYCWEDIEYLDIKTEKDGAFKRVAVLQKCFCDIPMSKIARTTTITETRTTSSNKTRSTAKSYTHTDIYGKYAIAFTKEWGKQHRIQPIHYIDISSPFATLLSISICNYLQSDSDDETSVNGAMLELQLALAKPHFGKMLRKDEKDNAVTIIKNFYDEQEWRYIPDAIDSNFEIIIANEFYFIKRHDGKSPIDIFNERLVQTDNNSLWLHFNYSDISYMIVADDDTRTKIIHHLLGLPIDEQERYTLISKMLTVEQITGDM